MRLSRLLVSMCVVAVGISSAVAQEQARLLIEVTRGGTLIAKPELVLPSGRGEGRLELGGEGAEKIAVTPVVQGDDISLAFQIVSGAKQFRPSLVISKDVRGSVEWTAADGQPIRLTVTWIQ